jgi:hypothetical protein
VTEYLAGGCATDAYRAAYQASQMSDGAIQVEASRLLDNPKVAAAIDQHRVALAKKARHSLQDCVADQERAMELAEASGNASAYAQAAMNKGQAAGSCHREGRGSDRPAGSRRSQAGHQLDLGRATAKAEDQSAMPAVRH